MTYTHKIGATLRLVGQLKLNGQVQDMTGWAASSQMRGPDAVIDLECAFTEPASAVLELHAHAADQAAWRKGRYAVDVRVESPDGEVLISSSATIELVESVTRAG